MFSGFLGWESSSLPALSPVPPHLLLPTPVWLKSVLRKPRLPFPLWKWLAAKRAVN